MLSIPPHVDIALRPRLNTAICIMTHAFLTLDESKCTEIDKFKVRKEARPVPLWCGHRGRQIRGGAPRAIGDSRDVRAPASDR